ncbi:hypothetical protein RFN57_03585 [Streptomyces violaceochromogenes]|uniref:Uncharacterized protein n=1 Tax=Streptomyces violaceochromogenes TaxID=67377 RepID=A0ABU6LPH8_9ACTN|nr:hypothetical protein [Streptomyces violaceochromogenes]MEC7051388.1 hypothetical protein [Streptomyces violaceochromogenes]GHC94153.1 hypothetical protein GCM10010309_79200 [Streptomyces violaceochromogenes]
MPAVRAVVVHRHRLPARGGTRPGLGRLLCTDGGERMITSLTDEERKELSRKVAETNKRSQDRPR